MKKIAEYASECGNKIILIPCASDPDSLDAFIDTTTGFAMMDGTAPHIEDPALPGAAHHIIYTGDCWDDSLLSSQKNEISALSENISDMHALSVAHIKAAEALRSENARRSKKHIRKKEIYSFTEEILASLARTDCDSLVHKALLSAVSVGKTVFFKDTLSVMADKIYSVRDSYSSASDYLLKRIKDGAQGRGVPVIECPCPTNPELTEHIILPTERIAVTVASPFHIDESKSEILLDGLYKDEFDEEIPLLLLEASKGHIKEAEMYIEKAKALHDELEGFYRSAMDYSLIDGIITDIKNRFY